MSLDGDAITLSMSILERSECTLGHCTALSYVTDDRLTVWKDTNKESDLLCTLDSGSLVTDTVTRRPHRSGNQACQTVYRAHHMEPQDQRKISDTHDNLGSIVHRNKAFVQLGLGRWGWRLRTDDRSRDVVVHEMWSFTVALDEQSCA